MKTSIAVDKDQYDREGYTIVRRLIDKEQVAKLSERLNMAARGQLDPGIARQIEPGKEEEAKKMTDPLPLVRKVARLAVNDPFFRDFVSRDEFLEVAGGIVGDNLHYLGDEAQLKPPHFGSPHPWHQDAPYFRALKRDFVTIWIAVDPATVENGCMEVIPRSHLRGVLERPDDKKSWFEDGEISVNGAVPAVLNPGDALVFHSLTLHGSGPNRTDFARRSMIFRYLNKDGMTPEEWTLVDRKLGALRPGWDKLPIFQR